ncbi:DoxX family protein [Kribbella antibiotica]|uniref:DoxX family protein n=1 Tax=Kribbella antibiotica TaxID=190195 RepID=A0A4R4ZL57_9ACTN|nr:DoxX family protein [Kribbella antibiotica]TDD58349.1 DoxX family protein [Kribbella antibiotica]
MTVVRALARPLLSAIFVAQGVSSVRNPDPFVAKAQPVTDRLVPLLKKAAPPQIGDRIPESTASLIRLNGAAQVLAGLALATGKGRRLGATVLAASLVPTTLAAHAFWQEDDKEAKALQRYQFMKNLGLLGGLLLAAVDTEGKPGVAWRASHGAKAAKRETKRGAKAAKREARQLTRDAKAAARLAKAELHLG